LIFLGDLIDRGPESADVVERLRHIHDKTCAASTRFILGNHEEVFLAVLAGDTDALRLFHRIGGYETLLSYGIPDEEYRELPSDELVERIAASVPQKHIEFLKSFENLIVVGDYAFVHAGVRPGRALSDQKSKDLRWIRNEFLRHPQTFEKVVVHGHSISHDVEILPNRIGIDTGAYASGKLTALGLEGHDQWVVQTTPSREDHASAPQVVDS
jgi:serine/threonine protein phosphatase 1